MADAAETVNIQSIRTVLDANSNLSKNKIGKNFVDNSLKIEGSSFESQLSVSFQRGPRYRLLLDELVKNAGDNIRKNIDFIKAKNSLEFNLNKINNAQKMQDIGSLLRKEKSLSSEMQDIRSKIENNLSLNIGEQKEFINFLADRKNRYKSKNGSISLKDDLAYKENFELLMERRKEYILELEKIRDQNIKNTLDTNARNKNIAAEKDLLIKDIDEEVNRLQGYLDEIKKAKESKKINSLDQTLYRNNQTSLESDIAEHGRNIKELRK